MEIEILIREATSVDKGAVLRIHDNVYDGHDYLPDYYDYFMEAPHITCFLAEAGGDIVGFVARCLVDNGETVVDRAGRVRPDLHGKGVYRALMNHVTAVSKSSGRTKRQAITGFGGNKSESFLAKHRHITQMKIIHFQFEPKRDEESTIDVSMVDPMAPDFQGSNLRKVRQSDLADFFVGDVADYLFPGNKLIIDYVPFRILQSNASIAKGKDTVFASDVDITSPFKHGGLLSGSSVFKCPRPGVMCNMDVFGSDVSSFHHHLLFHLKRLLAFSTEPSILAVHWEQSVSVVDTVLTRQVFDDLGLNLLSLRLLDEQMMFFERDV